MVLFRMNKKHQMPRNFIKSDIKHKAGVARQPDRANAVRANAVVDRCVEGVTIELFPVYLHQ
jgi:hypothetical protein